MNNTTSLTKMQRELVAVTEERDRLAAELQKLRAAPAYKKCAGCNGHGMLGNGHPDCSDVVCHFCEGTGVDSLPAVPAPSVPEEWVNFVRLVITEVDEGGLCIANLADKGRALLQSAEGRCSQTHSEVRHD